MGFKMRKGKNTSFKDLGSSLKQQRLHGATRPSSIYDERRAAGIESTGMSPRQRRFDIANLQENPSDVYSDEVLGEGGWEQRFTPASETQVPIRDKEFDRNRRGKLTRKGKKQMEEYISMIERRRQDPRIRDLKKDRSKSQLTRSMIERGFSQVQDPYGNWHAINRQGNLIGSRFGYSPESRAWRDKMSLAPGQTSHMGDKIEKGTELTIDYPKTQKQNITRETKKKTIKKTGKSFDEAFAEARKAGKKTFKWSGKKTGGEERSFNTMLKGEKREDWLKNVVKDNK